MATYMNKGNASPGDGLTPATGWRDTTEIVGSTVAANGNRLIFVDDTGPYFFGPNSPNSELALTRDGLVVEFGNNTLTAQIDLDPSVLKWTQSVEDTNLWYLVTLADGDPGYNNPANGAIQEYYRSTTVSNDGNRQRWGTDNADPTGMDAKNWAYGDINTEVGFDTVYIRTDGTDPNTLGNDEIILNSDNTGINFVNSNRPDWEIFGSVGCKMICGKLNTKMAASTGTGWRIHNIIFQYQDNTAIQSTGSIGAKPPVVYCCLFFWSGHGATESNNTSPGMKEYNNIHYADHVAYKSTAVKSSGANQIYTAKNCIFKYQGEGGFDFRNTENGNDTQKADTSFTVDMDFNHHDYRLAETPDQTSNQINGDALYRGSINNTGGAAGPSNVALWPAFGANSSPAGGATTLNFDLSYPLLWAFDARPLYEAEVGMIPAGFAATNPDSFSSSDFRLLTTAPGVGTGTDWWTGEGISEPLGLDGILIGENMGAFGGFVAADAPTLTGPLTHTLTHSLTHSLTG